MRLYPRARARDAHRDEGGQTIVLVALLFVVLLAFAALSLDVGRFYAERRYLQNAVDSAALACARGYTTGGTAQTAWNAGDNILQKFNLKADPIGATLTYPGAGDQISGYTAAPVYDQNIVSAQNLTGGILPIAAPLGCRVAITVNVDTYFIKLVQPNLTQIGMITKAYATSFRGYIGLDVRDFQTTDGSNNPIPLAYNGVSPTASVNTLKSFEANWINAGYPGPDICVVDPANFLPCAEISALDGSSSGQFVSNYQQFFNVNDVILLQLYDGTVKSIPDFTIQAPSLVVPTNGALTATTVQYTMNTQFQAPGSV